MSSAVTPLVSVVMPVYNGETFLAEAIESVLAQTYSNWEFLILDNASSDRTAEIIASYAACEPRIQVSRNPELLPQIPNWNRSMQLISEGSKYCKVIHADDVLFAECIEKMVDVAERYPSTVVVGAYRIDGQTVNMTSVPYPQECVDGKTLCRKRLLGEWGDQFGSPASIMYRSAVIRARGDECYKLENPCTDTELGFELLREGDYGFVHQVLTMTRRHGATETAAMRQSGVHSMGRTMIARDLGGYFLNETEHRFAMALQLRYHNQFLARNFNRLLNAEFRKKNMELYRSCRMRLNPFAVLFWAIRNSARNLGSFVSNWVRPRQAG